MLAPEGYAFVLIPALAGIFSWLLGHETVAVLFWAAAVGAAIHFRRRRRHPTVPSSSGPTRQA